MRLSDEKDRPWRRALAWLLFLGPFFFLTYNAANAAAARRIHVATLIFPWERNVPFLAWTIVPYWSSDLLYALSLPICRTRQEVDLHAKRLLAIQVFATGCFLLFPLRCAFEPLPVTGWMGLLFAALRSFDQPFNQAPSLHAALAVILWTRYRAHTRGLLRMSLAAWLVVVAVSSLTTHQHQFIDLPTGLWAGLLVVAALPEQRAAAPQFPLSPAYLVGSALCTVAAFYFRGTGWLLLWPGFALSMVACAYWTGDPGWLGRRDPWLRWPSALLMLPFTVAAWLNSRLWTRRLPEKNHLMDGVWIGRAPIPWGRDGIRSVVCLAPELPVRADAHIAMLDLAPPGVQQIDEAVRAVMKLSGQRPTLVCCALGLSRSAVASAAWLIASGHATGADDALEQLRRVRPWVVVRPSLKQRLDEWAVWRDGSAG